MPFILRIILVLLAFLLLDIYGYRTVASITKKKIYRIGYLFLNLSLFIFSILSFLYFKSVHEHSIEFYSFTFLCILYIPKIGLFLLHTIEDISALFLGIYKKIKTGTFSFKKNKRLNKVYTIVYLLCLLFFLYGFFWGRDDFKIERITLSFDNLPKEFDGFTITQISDLHLGSFGGNEKLQKVVNIINKENSDLFVFTGDLVNTIALEALPYKEAMSNISAKYGKISILGNHDYGKYTTWNNEEERMQNIQDMRNFYKNTGFILLENSNICLKKDSAKIYILGSENYSYKNNNADFTKTIAGIDDNYFKVLLTHDPFHFDNEIKNHRINIPLTISGHTHGLQFGFMIGNFKWSLIRLLKDKWMGLYYENNKYLYINRGIGVSSLLLLRVGISPEITVFTLKCT